MKVKQYHEVPGMQYVKTIEGLIDYANQLAEEFGIDTEYDCRGHDMSEYITIMRDETKAEKFKRELVEEAYVKLRKCSDVEIHTFWRNTLGQNTYVQIINNLNQEK